MKKAYKNSVASLSLRSRQRREKQSLTRIISLLVIFTFSLSNISFALNLPQKTTQQNCLAVPKLNGTIIGNKLAIKIRENIPFENLLNALKLNLGLLAEATDRPTREKRIDDVKLNLFQIEYAAKDSIDYAWNEQTKKHYAKQLAKIVTPYITKKEYAFLIDSLIEIATTFGFLTKSDTADLIRNIKKTSTPEAYKRYNPLIGKILARIVQKPGSPTKKVALSIGEFGYEAKIVAVVSDTMRREYLGEEGLERLNEIEKMVKNIIEKEDFLSKMIKKKNVEVKTEVGYIETTDGTPAPMALILEQVDDKKVLSIVVDIDFILMSLGKGYDSVKQESFNLPVMKRLFNMKIPTRYDKLVGRKAESFIERLLWTNLLHEPFDAAALIYGTKLDSEMENILSHSIYNKIDILQALAERLGINFAKELDNTELVAELLKAGTKYIHEHLSGNLAATLLFQYFMEEHEDMPEENDNGYSKHQLMLEQYVKAKLSLPTYIWLRDVFPELNLSVKDIVEEAKGMLEYIYEDLSAYDYDDIESDFSEFLRGRKLTETIFTPAKPEKIKAQDVLNFGDDDFVVMKALIVPQKGASKPYHYKVLPVKNASKEALRFPAGPILKLANPADFRRFIMKSGNDYYIDLLRELPEVSKPIGEVKLSIGGIKEKSYSIILTGVWEEYILPLAELIYATTQSISKRTKSFDVNNHTLLRVQIEKSFMDRWSFSIYPYNPETGLPIYNYHNSIVLDWREQLNMEHLEGKGFLLKSSWINVYADDSIENIAGQIAKLIDANIITIPSGEKAATILRTEFDQNRYSVANLADSLE